MLKQRARERIANRSKEEKRSQNRYKREWAQNSERLRVSKREKSREYRANLTEEELEQRREKERAYAVMAIMRSLKTGTGALAEAGRSTTV